MMLRGRLHGFCTAGEGCPIACAVGNKFNYTPNRLRGVRMYLGIETQTGLIYAGSNVGLLTPAARIPTVTLARLIRGPDDWGNVPTGPVSWVLREDIFDPVTRTRRGRLYETDTGFAQPSSQAALHKCDDVAELCDHREICERQTADDKSVLAVLVSQSTDPSG